MFHALIYYMYPFVLGVHLLRRCRSYLFFTLMPVTNTAYPTLLTLSLFIAYPLSLLRAQSMSTTHTVAFLLTLFKRFINLTFQPTAIGLNYGRYNWL